MSFAATKRSPEGQSSTRSHLFSPNPNKPSSFNPHPIFDSHISIISSTSIHQNTSLLIKRRLVLSSTHLYVSFLSPILSHSRFVSSFQHRWRARLFPQTRRPIIRISRHLWSRSTIPSQSLFLGVCEYFSWHPIIPFLVARQLAGGRRRR
jgi:hypothetical protein